MVNITQGISPGDLLDVEKKFTSLDLDVSTAVFYYNVELSRWEVYSALDKGTLISNNVDGWE